MSGRLLRARRARRARRGLRSAAAAALLLATVAACGGEGEGEGAPVRVVIPPGSSFRAAADSLERAGVVGSSRFFRLYAKLRGQDRSLRPGTYELRPGTGWDAAIAALTQGRGLVASITIPEGFTLAAIVPLLAERLDAPQDSVLAAVRDSAELARLDIPSGTLEGYLFPETYSFSVGTPARAAVAAMVREFERRWHPAWTARLDTLGLTRHEVVTLASIVEKEARVADERPTIAAVYCNRLRQGMLLQADPTVQYALGSHVERVLYAHLETESPYNTYRVAGLPPGPIASPGSASLEAALYPADVPFLFFVARPDGRHEFRRTFAEHVQARQEVRRMAAGRDSAAVAPTASVTGGMDSTSGTAGAAGAQPADSSAPAQARCG